MKWQRRLQRKQLLKYSSRKERNFEGSLIRRNDIDLRIGKQLAKEREDVAGVNCLRDESGSIVD